MADGFSAVLDSTVGAGQGLKAPGAGMPDVGKFMSDLESKQKPELEKLKEIDKKQSDNISTDITKGNDLLAQMDKIQKPADPQFHKLPDQPDSQYKDPMQALGSMASALALFGSLRTRAPLTAALNSAAGAMQGFHKGDQERVKLEREKWNDELNKALKQNQEELQRYHAALEGSQFDLTKASSKFRVIAAETQNHAMLAAIESGDPQRMYDMYSHNATLATRMLDLQAKHLEREAQLKISQQQHADANKVLVTGPDGNQYTIDKRTTPALPDDMKGAKKFGAAGGSTASVIPEEYRNMHGQEFLDKLPAGKAADVKAISEGRMGFTALGYRGQERAEMAQLVNQYNPNYQQGLFAAKSGVLKDFTSGPQSKNIIAINQAISHMGTLDELGAALKNKDIQAVNRLTNLLATEFGDPRVNNFELATQAVGDELMRTFRQVGASENEAVAFQKKFQVAGSPDQIHEALQTGAKLLHGRIKAVNNSWKRGMDTEEDYPKLIDPEPARVLKGFGVEAVGSEPKRRATDVVPAGIPAGSNIIGKSPDGKDVYQSPDGKKWVP